MSPYIQLLYLAMTKPLGIIVEHENPQSARATFYAQRKKHGDPQLDTISITILEGQPNKLYLFRCPKESPPPSAEPTSGSSTTTSNGSETNTETPSESPKQSGLLSEASVTRLRSGSA